MAEGEGFEPSRAINPTRFPSVRHRPLGDPSFPDFYYTDTFDEITTIKLAVKQT